MQTVKLLEALLERPRDERHGFTLIEATGLRSGTIYPLLIRLEKLGWLESRWEGSERSGPRRRLYRLTAEGEPAARGLLARARARSGFAGRILAPHPPRGAVV